jgi:predicted aspartyl protease
MHDNDLHAAPATAARLLHAHPAMKRTRTAIVSAAAAAMLAACTIDARPDRVETPTDTMPGEVILEFTGPNDAALVVPVHLNGQGPFSFVLDTGATLTCVSEAVVDLLDLRREPGGGMGAGIGGAERIGIVRLDSIRVGDTLAHDMIACSIDLQQIQNLGAPIDGLVGLNFLRQFRVVLDFQRNIATFDPPAGTQ